MRHHRVHCPANRQMGQNMTGRPDNARRPRNKQAVNYIAGSPDAPWLGGLVHNGGDKEWVHWRWHLCCCTFPPTSSKLHIATSSITMCLPGTTCLGAPLSCLRGVLE